MATTTSPNVIIVKLLIDTKGKRVLLAEAGKDFTDFLFSLLSMPVGTIIRLLSSTNGIDMVGSLGKLYQSLENLSDTYIQSNFDKDILLKPKSSVVMGGSATSILSLTINDQLYTRGGSQAKLTYVAPSGAQVRSSSSSSGDDQKGGFVKGVVTYMIMDDLEVKPMSTISCIALLNTFRVT